LESPRNRWRHNTNYFPPDGIGWFARWLATQDSNLPDFDSTATMSPGVMASERDRDCVRGCLDGFLDDLGSFFQMGLSRDRFFSGFSWPGLFDDDPAGLRRLCGSDSARSDGITAPWKRHDGGSFPNCSTWHNSECFT
jgi:hypothetical protein